MKRLLLIVLLLTPGMPLWADSPTGKALCEKNFSSLRDRITKNPADENAWTEFRVCAVELKRWDEAIQVAMQARQKNRELAEPYLILGLAQMQQKNYERAVEHFDETIRLKPKQPLAYFQMGMAYLFLNEPEKASQAAERAVELDPTNPAHHRQYAYALMVLGQLDPAEAAAKKAIDLDKNDLAAHKILAKIYAKQGNTPASDEALAQVKEAEEKYAAAHPELVKKEEPPSTPALEKEEKKTEKEEDFEVIGKCIDQWNLMKDTVLRGDVSGSLEYFSDYLDTRSQYRDSFDRLGLPRLMSIFSGFGDLYDCEVIFASAHCKSIMKNAAGTVLVTKIRFERNPDHVWRIRSF